MSNEGPHTSDDARSRSSETFVHAAFSPVQPDSSALPSQRSTIVVQQNSPLLVSTPPQITRVLAYSYPFIQPLSKVAGLLTWTTEDPWESFLLLCIFWAITIYGDVIVRTTAPILFAVSLAYGMYARRHSLLSSRTWASNSQEQEPKASPKKRKASQDLGKRQHKSLDEIVAELQLFNSRCNILLDPLLRLTDFLSTQTTATSTTTRPALIALALRLLMLMPVWNVLTMGSLQLITTRRVVFFVGTVFLSWHSRPARVTRVILWRSRTIRRVCAVITALNFSGSHRTHNVVLKQSTTLPKPKTANEIAASLAAARRGTNTAGKTDTGREGIRLTFTIFENQRRWIGIGWTGSMLAYERAGWTDEHLNTTESKDRFQLPAVEGRARWQWCEDSKWEVDMEYTDDDHHDEKKGKTSSSDRARDKDDEGWTYYDNKWLHGRRGIDGWGRYTRRRRWIRDAMLVETPLDDKSTEDTTLSSTATPPATSKPTDTSSNHQLTASVGSTSSENKANLQTPVKRKWFRRRRSASNVTDTSSVTAVASEADDGTATLPRTRRDRDDSEDDGYVPLQFRGRQGAMESAWGVGEDAGMDLG